MQLLYLKLCLSIAFLHTTVFGIKHRDLELIDLIIQLKATDLSLFSTITLFSCSDNENNLKITRGLSKAFISSNIHDIRSKNFTWYKKTLQNL